MAITPKDYQKELPFDKIIQQKGEDTDDTVPMDVLFIGGGPAGLSGAIELANLIKKAKASGETFDDIEIGVLDKAENPGGHNLSGAVINPIGFKTLFPDLKESDFPFRNKVKKDQVVFLTKTGNFKLPTPPTMHNKGNYTASISEAVSWLSAKAEELGVNVLNNFPTNALLVKEGKVVGVKTTPAGLDREGNPAAQSMPSTELTAKVTVLTEGTRGTLTQAYMNWKDIKSKSNQIYALGVKEVLKVNKMPEGVIHTMGWPLSKTTFGGSFLYPMGEGKVSLGLVAGLDYKEHNLDVHTQLQNLKKHPFFEKYLKDAETLEWGAKTIPEGGYYAIPDKLYGDGLLMAGDCAGFVNVPALKGIHYAMMAGIYAARTIFQALKDEDYSEYKLKSYDDEIRSSFIYKDLKKVRNIRQAFKNGFNSGAVKAGIMTATGGLISFGGAIIEEDAMDPKDTNDVAVKNTGLSKVDAVYLSGNKTRDDIPSHLDSLDDIPKEVGEMYESLCPAGVYEFKYGKLTINAPNCIDCKATDVIGPRWEPREGGSGPNYKEM